MIFTTSWDDGYQLDMKLSKLLTDYGCTGTFYICPQQQYGKPMLTEEEIKELNEQHEVGAHSMTHPRLTRIPVEDARREINDSKRWIERITGKPCKIFCYPYGDESPNIRSLVEKAGFKGARTVETLQFKNESDPFGLPTSLQVYPFPWRKRWTRWWHPFDPLSRFRVYRKRLHQLDTPFMACRSWITLAKYLFTYALNSNQPFFHLWGHSEEVERYKMWGDLEQFLSFVKEYDNKVTHSPNSALVL